jgi:thiol-disulfide isomerase/thioredoxin
MVGYSAEMPTSRVLAAILLAAFPFSCEQAPPPAPPQAGAPAAPAVADPTAAPVSEAPKELGPVHKLTVRDLDGNPVSLAQYAGRPMIIEIWATWCGPCRQNRATVHSLQAGFPEKLVVIGVSMDTGPQLVKSFLQSNPANDGEFMATQEFNDFVALKNPSGLIPKTMYVDSRGRVADLAEGVQSAKWLQAMAKNLR